MTDQEIIDALKAYVNLRVYENDNFEVTGEDLRESYIEIIEKLWGIIQSGTFTPQGLQSVLDVDSFATIAAPFGVIANGNTFTLSDIGFSSFWENGSNNNGIIVSSLSNTVEIVADNNDSGIKSNVKLNPQDISVEVDGNGVVGGVLQTGATGTRIASKNNNQGNNNEISIIGDPNPLLGYKVSREYDPTNDAGALWDIDGDLRVRNIADNVSDTEVLTIDSTGLTHKSDIQSLIKNINSYIFLDTAAGYNLTEKANYSIQPLSSGEIPVNLPTASEAMLGEFEFFLMDSQFGATMRIVGTGYNSGSIPQRKQVIIKCVKRYLSSNSFEYAYVETFRES